MCSSLAAKGRHVSETQNLLSNRLLRALTVEQFEMMRPHLEPVRLPMGHVVCEPSTPIKWAVFPESGLVSVFAGATGRQLAAGLYGQDGMGPIELVFSADTSPLPHYVQVVGRGYRLPAHILKQVLADAPQASKLLRRYALAYMMQIAMTALASGTCTIEQRVARLILMIHDRCDGDDLRVTHEFLSKTLGVRRTGVTLAIQILEGEGMIRAVRGVITILDRSRLIGVAGQSYGLAEAEYEKLFRQGTPQLAEQCPQDWRFHV